MKNFRFIIEESDISGDEITVSKELAHRLNSVLRYKKGADIMLLVPGERDKAGRKITGEITAIDDEAVSIRLISSEPAQGSVLFTTLYLSLIKSKYFELALIKATELGVSRIVPLKAGRAVVKVGRESLEKKRARWETIVYNAACQCKRDDLPVITDIVSVQDIKSISDDAAVKIVCDESSTTHIRDHLRSLEEPAGISAAVGPEGGFTKEETALLVKCGFTPVLLSNSILRAETVPLYLMSVIRYEFG